MSDQTPAHKPQLEAIVKWIQAWRESDDCNAIDLLCDIEDELIALAAVLAERPSSVHLDRGMVRNLRRLALSLRNEAVVYPGATAAEIDLAADAIEASLAPQTPEALPMLADPVSLAPVEGRPDVNAIRARFHWYRECSDIEIHDHQSIEALAAYIERLEADLSRLTLEYRVHMRMITEGEAARKAEVARLREALKMLLDDIEDYQRMNHLGGEQNHSQVNARAVLKAEQEGK